MQERENQTHPIDDDSRLRPEDRIDRVIERVGTCLARLRKTKNIPIEFAFEDVMALPTYGRLKAALDSRGGNISLQQRGLSKESVLKDYNRISPYLLRCNYAWLVKHPQSNASSLAGRFAQTVFDLGLTPPCGNDISERLLRVTGAASQQEFEKVRSQVSDYAFANLTALVERTGGLGYYRDKYPDSRNSGDFLNEVFSHAHDLYFMEIANALELSGYDLGNPDIVTNTLYAAEDISVPERQI